VKYRVTCLTPLLVGDGQRLAPIDYMIWKDQVNVLDQNRIFRLLAKGSRLDSYLAQLKRAEKLDFASWGGFAQNFAGRRIPFEHPASSAVWERARAEHLFIPTFATGVRGPLLPGSALRGALRTGLLFSRWNNGILKDLAARLQGDHPPRKPGDAVEEQIIGPPGTSRMKSVAGADSHPVSESVMKIYLSRVSTLQSRGAKLELGWKQAPRGTVEGSRPDDATPTFAEMAAPGTVFQGGWSELAFYSLPEVTAALRWREPSTTPTLVKAANAYAEALLAQQARYAETAGLPLVGRSVESLKLRLSEAKQTGNACLLNLGWGGGLLTKSAFLDTGEESYRAVLRLIPLYARAIQSGLPFPKTRRILFLGNQPAALPGWTLVEFVG
jgi:CRISPR-associated protein Csm5